MYTLGLALYKDDPFLVQEDQASSSSPSSPQRNSNGYGSRSPRQESDDSPSSPGQKPRGEPSKSPRRSRSVSFTITPMEIEELEDGEILDDLSIINSPGSIVDGGSESDTPPAGVIPDGLRTIKKAARRTSGATRRVSTGSRGANKLKRLTRKQLKSSSDDPLLPQRSSQPSASQTKSNQTAVEVACKCAPGTTTKIFLPRCLACGLSPSSWCLGCVHEIGHDELQYIII